MFAKIRRLLCLFQSFNIAGEERQPWISFQDELKISYDSLISKFKYKILITNIGWYGMVLWEIL